jgi:arylsulfatase A-like enzyme
VVKLPKSLNQRAVKVASPISHIDIAATIPQLAGLSVPETFQGQAIDFSSPPQRPVFMYSNAIVRQYGIVRWPWKLMLTERPEGRVELYRLDSDPSESRDLASSASHKAESVELTSALRHWISVQRAYYESSTYRDKVPPKYVSGEGPGNAEVLRRAGSR